MRLAFFPSRPSSRSIGVLCVLTVAWVAYSVIDTVILSSSTLSNSFYIGLGLWCVCVGALWVGVAWGLLSGLLAFTITQSLGYVSIEQVLFLLTVTGFSAAYTSRMIRRVNLVLTLGIGTYIASLMEDWPTFSLVLSVFCFGAAISYLFGRAVRLQRDKTTHTKEQLRMLKIAQRENRRSLARELHDSVANDVTTIAMYAKEALIRRDEQFTSRALDLVLQRAESATGHLRRMVDVLREEGDGGIEGVEGVEATQPSITEDLELYHQELEAIGIPTSVGFSGDPRTLSAPIHRTVCTIVQEAVTNVLKYGDRTSPRASCDIRVSIEAKTVDVTVSSTAKGGRDPRHHRGLGSGLELLRERVEGFGGSLDYGNKENDKWILCAQGIHKD